MCIRDSASPTVVHHPSVAPDRPQEIAPADAEQRLRQAAHILANGAIRAALKQQAAQSELPSEAKDSQNPLPAPKKVPNRAKALKKGVEPNVLKSDIAALREPPALAASPLTCRTTPTETLVASVIAP